MTVSTIAIHGYCERENILARVIRGNEHGECPDLHIINHDVPGSSNFAISPTEGGRWMDNEFRNAVLTKRQLECLTWSAAGKSSFEIGQILDITERGVNWHINNAMKALGTVTRIQAVARGVHLGLIRVE